VALTERPAALRTQSTPDRRESADPGDDRSSPVAVAQGPPTTPSIPTRPSPADVIVGTWRQFVVDELGQSRYLGTFVVTKLGGGYRMQSQDQVQGPDVVNSLGLFDIRSNGETWSFNSNWGNGAIGNFVLRRVSPTLFEGDVLFQGRVVGHNKWVRVQ
jgi:hypothetical protein